MKIVVLVPSAEYKNYAGARIRYGRIGPILAEQGAELVLRDIADFGPAGTSADVLIISKCHDSRSLVAAAVMAERGCRVGVDLFDDYFSQFGDSRLVRYRTWLRQILDYCQFGLCSTRAMADVLETYRSGLPVHVMNDPASDLHLQALGQILESKSRRARASRQLTVAWFGVGDNPNFAVGIHDLTSFASRLRPLASTGMDVRLKVLTNARALTASGLARLRDLPFRASIYEWSELRERQLLDESFAVFLPVNSQPFSTAKSLNRAVTALTSGCQVMSAGYPLYRQLDSLIYRDAAEMISDLDRDRLRFSASRMDVYRDAMASYATASTEAEGLLVFLNNVERPAGQEGLLAVIHGHSTNGVAHKIARAIGGLSVASPYCATPLAFDVVFRGRARGLGMLVSEKAMKRLRPDMGVKVGPSSVHAGKKYVEILDLSSTPASAMDWSGSALPFQLATYRDCMEEISRRLAAVFGASRLILSESSPLPFQLVA
jgi:hypothetical protein